MSPFIATTLTLVLFGVMLAPLLWAFYARKVRVVLPLYALAWVMIGASQTGIVAGPRLTATSGLVIAPTSAMDDRCDRIREVAREAGLSVDTSQSDGPRIVGRYADQLPAEVRPIVIACLTNSAPAGATS